MQNLPPISCISVGVCSNRNSLVSVVMEKQVLMPAILRCDLNAVQNILDQLKGEILHSLSSSMWYMVMTPYLLPFIFLLVFFLHPALPPLSLSLLFSPLGNPAALTAALKECCSGGCNIFHILAFLGKPPDPSPSNQGERRGVAARTVPKGGMLREIMKQAMALASGSSVSQNMGEVV